MPEMSQGKEVKVEIVLSLDLVDLSAWLADWDEIKEKLREIAGIDTAKVLLPKIETLELDLGI